MVLSEEDMAEGSEDMILMEEDLAGDLAGDSVEMISMKEDFKADPDGDSDGRKMLSFFS